MLALTEAGVACSKDAAARPDLTLARQRRVTKEKDRRRDAPAPDTEAWKDVDHDLFDRLRAVRLKIARERGVPPYVIFHDTTLRELARLKPSTRRRAQRRLRHRRPQGRAARRGVRGRNPGMLRQLRTRIQRLTDHHGLNTDVTLLRTRLWTSEESATE